ncbi:MAG: DNA translocase FtsK 4TM domain-containing protein, partial [Bacteroidales bacterium]|nr:DNA translocase FtsK 4TM domain-containing protein [Bacteroidales bacterium]
MTKRTKKTEQPDDTTAENISLHTLKSEKFRFISGVFFMAFALFMLFAFSSYLFSWWIDFDQISHISAHDLFTDSSIKIRNIAGRMGAYTAHVFIRNGFGVSSFLFIWSAFGIGLKLLNIPILKLRKTIFHSTFFIVWSSIALGALTLTLEKWSILGGVFGFETADYLKAAIGIPGVIILLGVVLTIFLSVAYGMKFRLYPIIKNWFEKSKKDLQSDVNELLNEGETNENQELILDDEDAFSLFEQVEKQEPTNGFTTDDEVPFIIENTAEMTGNESETEEEENEEAEEDETPVRHGIETPYDPYLDLSNYKFPTLDLLEDYGMANAGNSKQTDELMANKKLIENTLKSFGVEIAQIKATIGPTVTLYEIVPASGVRISKIQNLENDIALSLAALGIRIIAPIPGKGTIGIEVPNLNKQIVPMKVMLDSPNFRDAKFDLPIALGKTIQNECFVADLAKMPHLLMA